MASETVEFASGAAELEKARRLRSGDADILRGRRGVMGVSYGLAAYGYPLGAITGVQGPTQAPVEQPLGEQFGGDMSGEGSGVGVGGDGGGSL